MCIYEITKTYYTNCELPGLGDGIDSHNITTKYLRQCKDPKPSPESGSVVCDERDQTPLAEVAVAGHTQLRGDCPACDAAKKACIKEQIVSSNICLIF